MNVVHFLFSLLAVAVTVYSTEFCNGVPGKYCFKDLSGYHDCHIDPKTDKTVDTLFNCTVPGTRCVCSFGRPCPSHLQENPCRHAGPILPLKASVFFEIQWKICTETQCGKNEFRRMQLYMDDSNPDKPKLRIDHNLQDFKDGVLLLWNSASSCTMYSYRFGTNICTKQISSFFPKHGFGDANKGWKYNGTEVVDGKILDKWYFVGGGASFFPLMKQSQLFVYVWKNEAYNRYEPFKIDLISKSAGAKYTTIMNMKTTFFSTSLPKGVFDIPTFCL